MKKYLSFFISMGLVAAALTGLLLCPAAAAQGAANGLAVCAAAIIPTLFPFMVVCSAFISLGLHIPLGRLVQPLTSRLLSISGAGASALLLGLIGGYPLGAAAVVDLYRSDSVTKREAHRLLFFCDNCGPAFIISVAGSLVFDDAALGFFFYCIHISSALLLALTVRRRLPASGQMPGAPPQNLASAFTQSVGRSALTCLTVCGFVVFFSALTGLLGESGILPALAGRISEATGAPLHFSSSLLTGLLELGVGVTSMAGLSPDVYSVCLCAFLLGWGGLSVQAQAAAVTAQSGLSPAPHLLGKLLHGLLSALLAAVFYPILF